MRKWLIPIAVTCAVILIGIAVCIIASGIGLFSFARSLPTIAATPVLSIGKNYWVNAIIPPPGPLAGLVTRDANVYNKPGNPISDPSITIVAIVPNTTEVNLVAIKQNWCYVRGVYNPMSGINIPTPEPPMPTLDFTKSFEGWIECDRLLDYQPTPYPTPNSTPQAP